MKSLIIFIAILISTNVISQNSDFYKENGKWGIKDKKGKILVKPEFDDCTGFYAGLGCVEKDGKWAYVDEKGKVISDFFDEVQMEWGSKDNMFLVRNNQKSAMLDKTGKPITEWYDKLEIIYESPYFIVAKDNKQAVMNNSLQLLTEWVDSIEFYDNEIESSYAFLYNKNKICVTGNRFMEKTEWVDSIYDFYYVLESGSFWAKKDGKYGLYDYNLKRMNYWFDVKSDLALMEETNTMFVTYNGKSALINSNHEVITEWFDAIDMTNPDLGYYPMTRITKDGKYGYLLADPKKPKIIGWYDGLFPEEDLDFYGAGIVKKGELYTVIDNDLKMGKTWYKYLYLLEYEGTMFAAGNSPDNLMVIDYKGKRIFDNMNDYSDQKSHVAKDINGFLLLFNDGKTINQWCHMESFYGEFALACHCGEEKKCTYIKHDGKPISDYIFDDGTYFEDGAAAVKIGFIWGIIDTSGNYLCKNKYHMLKHSFGKTMIAKYINSYGVIDFEGNTIIPFDYSYLEKMNDRYYIAEKDGKEGIIDTEGKIIIDFIYESIFSSSKNFARVRIYGRDGYYEIDINGKEVK